MESLQGHDAADTEAMGLLDQTGSGVHPVRKDGHLVSGADSEILGQPGIHQDLVVGHAFWRERRARGRDHRVGGRSSPGFDGIGQVGQEGHRPGKPRGRGLQNTGDRRVQEDAAAGQVHRGGRGRPGCRRARRAAGYDGTHRQFRVGQAESPGHPGIRGFRWCRCRERPQQGEVGPSLQSGRSGELRMVDEEVEGWQRARLRGEVSPFGGRKDPGDPDPQRHAGPVPGTDDRILGQRRRSVDPDNERVALLGIQVSGQCRVEGHRVRVQGNRGRPRGQLPETRGHAQHADLIGPGGAILPGDHPGQPQGEGGRGIGGEGLRGSPGSGQKAAVASVQQVFGPADPVQCPDPERLAHRISDGQGADQHGRRHRRREDHAQMVPRVEGEAAPPPSGGGQRRVLGSGHGWPQ